MRRSRRSLPVWATALLALAIAQAPAPAAAQSLEYYELTERIDRLQSEVQALRSALSRMAERERSTSAATQAEIRFNEFESLLRGLEKRIETLENGMRRDAERLNKLATELETRPQAPPAAAPPAAGAPMPPDGTVIGGTAAPDAPPRPLGTLKVAAPAETVAPPPPAAPVLPAGSAKDQYDYALSLTLKEADYTKAGAAFLAFIDRHPKHELTGNAFFWLGRTHFVRKDYESASFAFADGYKKFPRGPKAPDNLYNLGMSLRELGKKVEACTAFARLLDEFPKVNRTLKNRVSRQRKRLKCG